MTTATTSTQALGPKASPDEIAIARLRRVVAIQFGDVPLLDAHLSLLDSRGVLYATHVAEHWSDQTVEFFFGIVRHVVRSQCDGPAPDPDVEGWLATGRPEDPTLGFAWDTINAVRYPTSTRPATTRSAATEPAIARMDEIVADWPDHITTFARTYCQLEAFIELRGITIPPITT